MKEWKGLRVLPYAARKDVESSSEAIERFWERATEVKSSPLEEVSRVGGRGWEGCVPDEPHETFGRSVLFCFQFVEDEFLQSYRFKGRGELSVSYFLRLFVSRCWGGGEEGVP